MEYQLTDPGRSSEEKCRRITSILDPKLAALYSER